MGATRTIFLIVLLAVTSFSQLNARPKTRSSANSRRVPLEWMIQRTLKQAKPTLTAADFDQLSTCLVAGPTAPAHFPLTRGGRTVVIPGQSGSRGTVARHISRSGSKYLVSVDGKPLQVDARDIDSHHNYASWAKRKVLFADIAVDLGTDASARRFVENTVRKIDRSKPEVQQIAQAIMLIRRRLKYDRDYQVVVPQGMGSPRPLGFYINKGLGVCRHFSVALKLVSDALGITCRLERGTLGGTVLPLALGRRINDEVDWILGTRLSEVSAVCAGNSERGFHIWNEVQLQNGHCLAVDPTGNKILSTTRACATGLLRPIFDNPWHNYVGIQ